MDAPFRKPHQYLSQYYANFPLALRAILHPAPGWTMRLIRWHESAQEWRIVWRWEGDGCR